MAWFNVCLNVRSVQELMRGTQIDKSLQCALQAKAVKAREKAVVDTAKDDDEEVLRKREERDAAKKKEEKVDMVLKPPCYVLFSL